MSLLRQLAGDFDNAVVQRGGDYFRSGRVRVDFASTSRIVATVRGTTRYEVSLEREARKIRASCTCPYFDVALCKHIWAVIMAADTQQLLQGMGHGGVELVRGEVEVNDSGENNGYAYEDEDEQGDFAGSQRYPRRVRAAAVSTGRPPLLKRPRKSTTTNWRKQISQLDSTPSIRHPYRAEAWPSKRELLYVIDVENTRAGGGLYLEIFFHDLKRDGAWGKAKSQYLRRELLQQLPDLDDRHILAFLAGATQLYSRAEYKYGASGYDVNSYYDSALPFRYRLLSPQPELILPVICRTGRCRLRLRDKDEEQQWLPTTWEEDEPWQFRLEMRRSQRAGRYELTGALSRGERRMPLTEPVMLVDGGILLMREKAARYEHHGAFNWIALLRKQGPVFVPTAQCDEFLAELLRQPELPPLDLPEELRYEEIVLTPRPRLTIKLNQNGWRPEYLQAELSFAYGDVVVAHDEPGRGIVQTTPRRVLLRDLIAERKAEQRLQPLGLRWRPPAYPDPKTKLELPARQLPSVVRELTVEGWHIEAEGKVYRPPGKFNVQVHSGVDWFELHGAVEFGDTVAYLPELLAARES